MENKAVNINPNVGSLSELPHKQVFFTFAGVMLAMFLGALYQTIIGTAMPRIIADLGGFSQYAWVTSSYIITSAVAVPITGKLMDMYGRKPFYVAGLVIFVLMSLACGFSSTMTQIIVFRAIQGIGAGIMMAGAFTTIADLFPPAERGKYQGYISGIFGISSVVGPTIGGFLTDSLSWHWVFFFNVPLGVLIIALFIKFFPNLKPDNAKHSIDYLGLSTLILTVVPAMLALSWAGAEYAWGSPQIIGMFSFAFIMLGLFLFFETRAKEPIIPLSLFKNWIITVSVIGSFFTSVAMFGGIIFIPLFFQGVMGASATRSGNFLIPMMLGIVFGSFISGQLLSRTGGHYRIQAIIGTFLMCAGLFLLSRIHVDTTYGMIVLSTVITGMGLGATFPLFTIAVQNSVPNNMLGVATSSVTFFRSIGGSVGLAVLGSVMTNRFSSELFSRIPDNIKSGIPSDVLTSLSRNPQALVSTEAQAQLQNTLSQSVPPDSGAFEQILVALREALASSIAQVFLLSLVFAAVALIVNFFMREVPLRKHNPGPRPVPGQAPQMEGNKPKS